MRVMALNQVYLDENWWGWVEVAFSKEALNGRKACFIYGKSGMSSWHECTITFPQEFFQPSELLENGDKKGWDKAVFPAGSVFEFTRDKNGKPLIRVFKEGAYDKEAVIVITGNHLRGKGILVKAEAEGYSRTGRHGDLWSINAILPNKLIRKYCYEDEEPCFVLYDEKGEEHSYGCATSPEEW